MKGMGHWFGLVGVGVLLVIAASALGAVQGTTHKVSGVLDFEGVACPSQGPCIAVGETPRSSQNFSTGVFAAISHGKPGTAHKVPGTNRLSGVACPSANQCIAVGELFGSSGEKAVYVKISHGKAGSVHDLGINGAASIGCGSAASCWVLGDDFPANPTGPTSFHPAVVHLEHGKVTKTYKPMGSYDFFAGESGGAPPVCFSATSCIAVGSTDFGGKGPGAIFSLHKGRVKITHKVSGTDLLTGLSCTSSTSCTLVGDKQNGEVEEGEVATLSSGKVGSLRSVNVSTFPLACHSASACFSFGSTFSGGKSQSWVVPIDHGKPGTPEKMSSFATAATCQGKLCLAVGDVGQFPTQQGTVFSFRG
jgi:hypothetical protein